MSNHIYWRIYITEGYGTSPNLGYYTIAEIEMRASQGGADQCNGGTATAHDYYSATYAPSKAFDNDSGTWWASFLTNPTGWIKYTFASAVDVVEISITNRNLATNYPPKAFQLQWSDDNTNWTTVGTWSGVTWAQGETRVFRQTVYAKNQSLMPYELAVEVYRKSPYSTLVANQVKIPFGITLATSQRHPFAMPSPVVGNQVAMPFSTILAASNGQPYEGEIVRDFTASYDMTTRAASNLEQPFGIAVTKGVATSYAMTLATSLATGYAWTFEKSLEQPYASPLVAGCGHPYSLTLAAQNDQSFAILFATNSCEQPCPLQLEVYHVQPWHMPVAQANTQPLYDTVCKAGRQPWSIMWPAAQANGQSFDRTITVTTSQCQPHDLLAHNPVAKSLTSSWDLSTNRPPLRLDGGARVFHFGVPL